MNRLLAVTFLLTIGLLFVFSTDDDTVNQCVKEVGLNKETAHTNFKCYYDCLLEKEKVIVNGTINLPNIRKAEPCLDVKANFKCGLGMALGECLYAHLSGKEFEEEFGAFFRRPHFE